MTHGVSKSAIEMYNCHGQLGLKRTDLQYGSVVQDAANPDLWGSNKVFEIRAGSVAEISELMTEVDEVCAQLPYRHFVIDSLTPESLEEHLAFSEYSEFCRQRGADPILIGSHASEPPKPLYNRLGFNSAFVPRDLIKHL